MNASIIDEHGPYPTTLEGMVEFFEQHKDSGQYDLLWNAEGVRLTTARPEWRTLAVVLDDRAAAIAMDKLARKVLG